MYFIGVDLGGTSAKCAIFDENKIVKKYFSVPTVVDNQWENSDLILQNLKKHINKELKNNGLSLEDISGISLTVPGRYNIAKGTISLAPNINWKNYPIIKEAKKIWQEKSITCLNDADAAAVGQCYESNLKNIIVYIIGTGVGGGIIKNGQLTFDKEGYSTGEFGHCSGEVTQEYSQLECNCGLTGCLETVCSAPLINKSISDYIEKHPNSELSKFQLENNLEKLTTVELNEFIKDVSEEDSKFLIFKEILTPALLPLAKHIVALCSINPDFKNSNFFIAGGGAKIDGRFLDILKGEITNCDEKLNISLSISNNPDKLALTGVINYTLNEAKQCHLQKSKEADIECSL